MKLQHCNKAQIYTVQENLICNADVIGDVEDNSTTLRFNGSRKDILETEVLVKFLDAAQGVLPCICRLSEYDEEFEHTVETEEPDEENAAASSEEDAPKDGTSITCTVKCTIVAEHEVIQRRQDVKVSINLETSASFLDENQQLESCDILILDISAGGMFCLSKQKWPEKQVFAAKIFDKTLPVDIEVIRVQTAHSYSPDYAPDDPRFGYGCQFINLSQASESALRKFVYQQQLQRRRMRR